MPFSCGLSPAKMAFFQPLSLPDACTDAPKRALARPRCVSLASGRKKPPLGFVHLQLASYIVVLDIVSF